jgi:hypothetical protein
MSCAADRIRTDGGSYGSGMHVAPMVPVGNEEIPVTGMAHVAVDCPTPGGLGHTTESSPSQPRRLEASVLDRLERIDSRMDKQQQDFTSAIGSFFGEVCGLAQSFVFTCLERSILLVLVPCVLMYFKWYQLPRQFARHV